MVRIALVLAFVATACTTDGNSLTGRWNATNCHDGLFATGVTVAVAGNDGSKLTEHADCSDEGFAMIIPFSITAATVTATDGYGAVYTTDITITDAVDLGTIFFDPGTQPD